MTKESSHPPTTSNSPFTQFPVRSTTRSSKSGRLVDLRSERRRASFGDLLILLDSARAHTDGTHYLAFSHQGDAPGEHDEASAVGVAQAEDGAAGPRILLQVHRLLLEGDGGVGFVDRDRDAANERSVHPDMRLEVATGVHHRDVHGLPDLLGLPHGGVDDPPRLLQGYGLLRLGGFRHNLPFPLLSVYARSRALATPPPSIYAGTISDTRALCSCSLVVPNRR